MADPEAEALLELEEALGEALGPHERELIHAAALRGDLGQYVEDRALMFRRARRDVALQAAHGRFIADRRKLAEALSEGLTKIVAGGRTLEERVPVSVHHRSGALQVGSRPPPPEDGSGSCLDSTDLPGQQELLELFSLVEHLPVKLEAFSSEMEPVECTKHDTHLGALAFAGIPDVQELDLEPCVCKTGGTHRYRATSVKIAVPPFAWGPGTEFDAPCPEAEADLEKFVATGAVVDLLAKHPKEAPEAPPTPGPEEMLAVRLEELTATREAD